MTEIAPNPLGSRDYALEAHQAAEDHLDACMEALFEEETRRVSDVASQVEWPETDGLFCGCQTCVVREVLLAAWPILVQAVQAGEQ